MEQKERKIVGRWEAAFAGNNRYYTGRPCIHGHDSERYVTSGQCCQCTIERAAARSGKFRETLAKAQEAKSQGA